MKRHILHSILIVAFFMLTKTVLAQPAVLPLWVPEENPQQGEGQESGLPESGEDITYLLPSIAVLDIEGPAPMMSLVDPSGIGSILPEVTSSASWLNYTSIVSPSSTNKVTVEITSGTVPVGTVLKVVVAANSGNGDGNMGTASNQLTLTSFAQEIITDIGSCYTGDGIGNGHQITYNWSTNPEEYSSIVAGEGSIVVTYTISSEGPPQ